MLFGKFQKIQTAVDLLSEFEHHTPVIILITLLWLSSCNFMSSNYKKSFKHKLSTSTLTDSAIIYLDISFDSIKMPLIWNKIECRSV